MAKRAPRRFRKTPKNDLRAVVDETIGLSQRLVWVADQLHGERGLRPVQRGILRGLVRYGAQTVPELARVRSVRRQSIQPVVDELAAGGLVELVANPKHASSKLVRITAKGEAIVARMDRADQRALAAAGAGLDPRALAVTAETLRALRQRFETTLRWRAAAGDERASGPMSFG